MSKIIVYYEGKKVTGYEVVEPNILEAFRFGLAGEDAVAFDRATKQLGRDVVARFMKTTPQMTEDEALGVYATAKGRAYMLVDSAALPPGEFENWLVDGGKLKAA
jgi:hypothetical protein